MSDLISRQDVPDTNVGDMISRQDAIDAAEFGITYAKAVDKNTGEVINLFEESNKELKKAVERIKNLPSAEPEPILDKIRSEIGELYINLTYKENSRRGASWGLRRALEIIDKYKSKSDIEELPSAQPERKKGKWIPDEIAAYDMPKGEPRGWVPWLCSECGWCVGKHQTAFCPSCGADMRGEQDDPSDDNNYDELVEFADTIAEQEIIKLPEPHWIPCSERLPEGSQIVLLTLPKYIDDYGQKFYASVICGHYIGGKDCEWGISDGTRVGYGLVSVRYGVSPIAWMPLPEPYREVKE